MRKLRDSTKKYQNDDNQERSYESIHSFEVSNLDEEIGITIDNHHNTLHFTTNAHDLKTRWNVLALILLMGGIISYYNIHELCPYETDGQCVNAFLKPKVQKWVTMGIFSSFCFVGLFFLAIKGFVNIYFILAEGVALVYFLIYQDHIISTTNYQAVFQLGEACFILILASIVGCGSFCYKQYQKQGRIFVISTLSILALSYFYSKFKVSKSCQTWREGIGGAKIDQRGGYCTVVEPKACWYDLFHGKMDASKLYDCTREPI